MFNVKNWRRLWHITPVLIVGIVGVVASISVWYLTAASENRTFELEYARRADNQANVLNTGLDDHFDKLYAVRAFFNSSDDVTRAAFESFSNEVLVGHPAMLNVGWFPRVRREERLAHELAGVKDGLPDYHIRAIATDRSLPVASERDEYFPKFYSTEARTSPVYGLDLKDGGARERTLARIRDGNILSTSPPLLLHIGQGDRRGFWAGLPVYARGQPHETLEDRRRNLIGIVQGVFQIGVMIDSIFTGVKSPARLYLFAPGAAANDPPIYFTSHLGTGSIKARTQAELAIGLHKSFPLNFGDVAWTMVITPNPADLLSSEHDRSSIVLIFGLLLSAGLTSFIWMMRRYARNIEIANDKYTLQNLQFDAALNNMTQGLLMYDRAGKLIISNRRMADLFGMPWEKWKTAAIGTMVPQSMKLAHDLSNVAVKDPKQVFAELQTILDSRKPGRIVFARTDGHMYSSLCSPMTDGGFVITFNDITERRRAEEKISHMAHYDALTDLPNRALFYQKMDELLTGAPQNGKFAVLSLDLDRFKNVNDTLGHPIGDKLLQAVADRMRGCVRETDVVARLGGDEFAILQTPFDELADAIPLATRLIDAISAPYRIDGNQVVVGTSIGIAIAPEDGSDPDQLMQNADLALYASKEHGGSTYRFFKKQMEARRQKSLTLKVAV